MGEVLEKSTNLDGRAVAAKESSDEMERLIVDFRPFLRANAAKYSSPRDGVWRDDLFSTAMIAFYEAIQNYDIDKGHFFPFASRVVYRRIVDIIRKAYKYKEHTVPLEAVDGESPSALEKVSANAYLEENRQIQLIDEIDRFQSELAEWGITMESLSKHSPKHKKQREMYKMLVSKIFQTLDIMHTIRVKRYFPIKAITKITGLSPKKLERARIFILTSLIIKSGDYVVLSEYIDYTGGNLH